MDRLFAMERHRDGSRVEFFSEVRNGKTVYIIREAGGASQDSVTNDRDAMDAFRQGLLRDGYMQMPF